MLLSAHPFPLGGHSFVRANQTRELLKKFERKFSVDGNKGARAEADAPVIQATVTTSLGLFDLYPMIRRK